MNRLVVAAVASIVVAGCATFEEGTPASYAGPTVQVRDTAETQSARLAYIFELREIDGRRLRSSGIATVSANQGRGFSQSAVVVGHKVPAVAAKVTIAASTQYAAPILAMTNPTCSVTGSVEFKPEPGKSYVVRGRIAPQACAVWIEDEQSKKPVTQEVSGPGMK
jgi:hypothetical protein